MDDKTIGLALFVYSVGVLCAFVMAPRYDDTEALADAVWWPISAIKALFKSLWRAVSSW
jgi:hypothetical protein